MLRWIIGVLVLWAIIRIARPLLRVRPAGGPSGQVLARCDHCGLHVPLREAVCDGDRRYCSVEHRRAALAAREKT